MKLLRIALLDDHAVVRLGLVSHLSAEPGIEVVGAYGSSRQLIKEIHNISVDVLLLDFTLGRDEVDGVSLIKALRTKLPNCHILVVSAQHEPATVSLALRVGASGFFGKDEDMSNLIQAIRTVASGSIYLSKEMAHQVVDSAKTSKVNVLSSADSPLQSAFLSAREQEVIRCYLSGMTVTEIAEKFNRSIKTVSTQKAAAFRKLGVNSNNELFKIKGLLE